MPTVNLCPSMIACFQTLYESKFRSSIETLIHTVLVGFEVESAVVFVVGAVVEFAVGVVEDFAVGYSPAGVRRFPLLDIARL